MLIREGVAKNIGVGIAYTDNLRSDVGHGRFVVLKGSDFHFTTLSRIVYSKNRELSPLAQKFLNLLRQAKRIPDYKKLDRIAGVTKERVIGLLKKSGKSGWLLYPMLAPLTDLLASM